MPCQFELSLLSLVCCLLFRCLLSVIVVLAVAIVVIVFSCFAIIVFAFAIVIVVTKHTQRPCR